MITNYSYLELWEATLATEAPDYQALYNQMIRFTESNVNVNVNVTNTTSVRYWSLLSEVCFGMTLNYDADSQKEVIIKKLKESIKFADKTWIVTPFNLEGNLANARALDRLAFFVTEAEEKAKCINLIAKCLFRSYEIMTESVFFRLHKPMFHFLQVNLLAAIYSSNDPQVYQLMKESEFASALLPLQPEELETKLCAAVQQLPNCIEAYLTLATLLKKMGKLEDAKQIIKGGLAVKKMTKWDEAISKKLEVLLGSF